MSPGRLKPKELVDGLGAASGTLLYQGETEKHPKRRGIFD
jgi:hypothetical protein